MQLLDTLRNDADTQRNYMETQCEDLEVGLEKFIALFDKLLVTASNQWNAMNSCARKSISDLSLDLSIYSKYREKAIV